MHLLHRSHILRYFNTIEYDFVDLQNLKNIFIKFVVNRTYAPFTHTRILLRLITILYLDLENLNNKVINFVVNRT